MKLFTGSSWGRQSGLVCAVVHGAYAHNGQGNNHTGLVIVLDMFTDTRGARKQQPHNPDASCCTVHLDRCKG